jgi:hypothetical protein
VKVQHKSFDEERSILIAMIVDTVVLGRLSNKWKPSMFESPHANRVGQWCVKYYKKYEKAPSSHIQSIYESWAADAQNKDQIEIIGSFLDSLSRQYKRLKHDSNSDYILDLACWHFNRVQLNRLTDTITGDIGQGKIERALTRVADYRKLEVGTTEPIDVLHNREAIMSAFSNRQEPLITYGQGLGKFFGSHLERDGLIAFQGPEKRGKSFMLQEIAFRAVIQKRKVAFFECGDLSQDQIMRRFMIRIAKRPAFPCKIKYPLSIRLKKVEGQAPIAKLTYKPKKFKEPLSWRKAYKACVKLTEERRLKSVWRLSCHYNGTLSVDDIRATLEDWDRDGWSPDVIVIDYADILRMEYTGLEGRDRYDETWKQLRRLSQERHCLVVTATQAAARAYKAQTQGQEHFSEDKRKNAHVTGMVGLNQTVKEKEKGVLRLNWIDLREGYFSPRRCCYVATCLELANMAVKSVF